MWLAIRPGNGFGLPADGGQEFLNLRIGETGEILEKLSFDFLADALEVISDPARSSGLNRIEERARLGFEILQFFLAFIRQFFFGVETSFGDVVFGLRDFLVLFLAEFSYFFFGVFFALGRVLLDACNILFGSVDVREYSRQIVGLPHGIAAQFGLPLLAGRGGIRYVEPRVAFGDYAVACGR